MITEAMNIMNVCFKEFNLFIVIFCISTLNLYIAPYNK
jgi:hypothetical protein